MIDFIFDYFPIIIVILGALASFFNNKEKGKDTSTDPVKTFPPMSEKGDHPSQRREPSPFEVLRRELSQKTYNEKKPVAEAQKQQVVPNHPELINTIDTTEKPSSTPNKAIQKDLDQLHYELQRKKQVAEGIRIAATTPNVIEGIIWSEVIGPPRAKKPYQSMSNQNKRDM